MKKIVFLIIGVVLMILGIIGLMLPVVPQIPFLVAGAIMLMLGSEKIKNYISNHHLFKDHVEPHIHKGKWISEIWEKINKEN
ncbi:MAG: DUF454 family protein [Lachnospiraceae bacterium]|nr:DUF454 family protein [Lachnospiraceae bacterium]